MRLATRLRTLRVAAGLSLTETADLTGVPKGDLSKIETGRALPRDEWVENLANAYGPADGWYEPRLLLLIQADRDEDAA